MSRNQKPDWLIQDLKNQREQRNAQLLSNVESFVYDLVDFEERMIELLELAKTESDADKRRGLLSLINEEATRRTDGLKETLKRNAK